MLTGALKQLSSGSVERSLCCQRAAGRTGGQREDRWGWREDGGGGSTGQGCEGRTGVEGGPLRGLLQLTVVWLREGDQIVKYLGLGDDLVLQCEETRGTQGPQVSGLYGYMESWMDHLPSGRAEGYSVWSGTWGA